MWYEFNRCSIYDIAASLKLAEDRFNSNKDADIYETNLMRRLAGLLYIDNKTMGDIKEKIKQNLEWHISLTTIVLSAS